MSDLTDDMFLSFKARRFSDKQRELQNRLDLMKLKKEIASNETNVKMYDALKHAYATLMLNTKETECLYTKAAIKIALNDASEGPVKL